jgi:hypothetical protein
MQKKLILSLFLFFAISPAFSQTRQMEYLNRGLVAVPASKGIFISWRLPGTESIKTAFNIYKNGKQLNQKPVYNATCYTDENVTLAD